MKNLDLHPDGHRRVPLRRLPLVLAAALLLSATACGSTPPADPATGAPQPTVGTDQGGTEQGADAQPIDACQLLTDDEVTPIIGEHDGGGPSAGVGESVCSWENPETYHSVTVSIGSWGTAASGQLPDESAYGPTEPGPDGIRFAPGGVAEFVVGDRASQLQITTRDLDRDVLVQLIGLIRSRV
jgi:hypothetical protein